MKTRFLVLSAFAFLLSTISSHADSVAYNTFGPGLSTDSVYGKLVDSGGSFLGTPFSPGSTVDLTSLTGSWDSGKFTGPQPPPRTITISLWTNPNGQPGTELESWQLSVTAMLENYTLSSSLHPLLLSGSTYWVLEFFTGGGAGDTIEWGRSSSAPAGGIWSGDSATSLSLGFPSFPIAALEVDGTPMPEPSSFMLLGSAVLGLGVWRRRGVRHWQA
jgi:hypothetical protein